MIHSRWDGQGVPGEILGTALSSCRLTSLQQAHVFASSSMWNCENRMICIFPCVWHGRTRWGTKYCTCNGSTDRWWNWKGKDEVAGGWASQRLVQHAWKCAGGTLVQKEVRQLWMNIWELAYMLLNRCHQNQSAHQIWGWAFSNITIYLVPAEWQVHMWQATNSRLHVFF